MSSGWHRLRILASVTAIGLVLFGVRPATAQYGSAYPAPMCPVSYYYWPGYGCVPNAPNGYYAPPAAYYAPPPLYYAPPAYYAPPVYAAPAFAFFDFRFGRPFFFHRGFDRDDFHGGFGGFHRH